ncbi:hypothetical protein SASPL_105447 [Salvia splendens]|uniref:Uncharacterized protein n=1 Tax=Salvia splendens TaxID=180675 RepID=A0A8X9ABL3_SALSN|nr:uncharacterized protein LOC121764069 [Salvia splendens]KAG6433829.1 hypothetical protein SASPL_105447 [Salvia splendens]
MAQELDDGEFWLPSEFLTDDDMLMDFKTEKRGNAFCNSDLSSPGSESDEDDFAPGLTRKLPHTPNFSTDHASKGWKLSGSPQSTLCGFKPGSSQSSPNSASRVSSPPVPKENIGWDLLCAAAGEVQRMRMTDETTPFHSNKPFPAAVPVKTPLPSAYYPNQAQTEAHIAFLQLQASHFQRMKQQNMFKNGVWALQQGKVEYHQFQNKNGKIDGEIGRNQQRLSMASWPTLQQSQQQQTGSGMRAVFLGETGAKKERTGTGVFLPRRFGTTPAENRNKPVCSTVLLPDRVIHALNLNLDGGLKERNHNALFSQQRRSQPAAPTRSQELRLPQEWTY